MISRIRDMRLKRLHITLEQSKFEPPATIRQAEITLDKAQTDTRTEKKEL